MLFTLLLSVCGLIAGVAAQTSIDYKVQTTEGTVVGAKAMDGDYIEFYGIPYAGSVSGENRFKAAPRPAKHNVEFKAVEMGIFCVQPSVHGQVGKEDCLTLNIFTRNFTTPKPVIVWLDGEEYLKSDTPRYSFKSLVQSDIVFVAVNYRLSIFGFLCLGVEEAPGNAGLKDVVQALKWIQENVAGFGGDPNNVMLLGHGSGAALVDLLTMSPLTEGLLAKAVALSGSALSPWAMAQDPAGYAKALGEKLQYTDKSNAELATLLTNTPVDVLINEINQFSFTNNSVLFAPCVENTKLNGSFLEDDPLKLIQRGKYQKIPFIASYVNREGTMRVKEAVHSKWLKKMQDDFKAFLPANLDLKNETVRNNVSEEVRLFYFGDTKDISDTTPDNIHDYFSYQGDSLITVPVIRGVQERAKSGSQPWLLEFAYKDVNYDWPYPNIRLDGVKHGDILDYIFDLDSKHVSEKPKKSLVERLVAFAKNGQPGDGTLWMPYTANESYYLSISGHAGGTSENPSPTFAETMQLKPHDQYVNFWENSLSMYYATTPQVSSARTLLASGLTLIMCILTLSASYTSF
ncbi:hypothetical protein ABMA28_006480 [Loxostege sticticalis]|uniref:Carboxylesterase type B domain-containing protein n=1 Tax=Loxostege sticticalis TaxID=481309 RepID=A0ABD0SLD2_LOXSC